MLEGAGVGDSSAQEMQTASLPGPLSRAMGTAASDGRLPTPEAWWLGLRSLFWGGLIGTATQQG